MPSSKIRIPKEQHIVIEFRQRNLPGFATVNAALKEFEPKSAFPWHLSILIAYDDLIKNQLPSKAEQDILYEFENKLDRVIKRKRSSLFLARVTHDARRELIWRIQNPDATNSVLQEVLRTKRYPREFEYQMEHDPNWKKTTWYLGNVDLAERTGL